MQKATALASAYRTCKQHEYRNPQVRLITRLLKRDLGYDREQLLWLLRCAVKSHGVTWMAPWAVILGHCLVRSAAFQA